MSYPYRVSLNRNSYVVCCLLVSWILGTVTNSCSGADTRTLGLVENVLCPIALQGPDGSGQLGRY